MDRIEKGLFLYFARYFRYLFVWSTRSIIHEFYGIFNIIKMIDRIL